MSYQALYRKYRPRRFSELVGQDHIVTILQNQVANGRIAHAYLFCGSRGTGKTSTAKILARAINCLHPEGGEPCGACEHCKLSLSEDAVDIIELDAASNNGVEDMRMLLEKAHFTPLHLPIKVYIIDEVHALSPNAFNALLKTLEEPPRHLVFMLATTEPQKLPATIISRCQRFDFRRLSLGAIMDNLRAVLHKAGASIEEEGLLTIARAADGGMRDALSLADQCLAFCGNTVSARDVYDVLGVMEQDSLFTMANALLSGDAAAALRRLDEIVMSGRDLGVFVQDLARHMRALLIAKACGHCPELLDCTEETMARYEAEAARASESWLLNGLQLLLRAQGEMRYLRQPRVLVESVLARICRPEDSVSLLSLEERIARLEARLASGAPIPPAAPAPSAQDDPPLMEAPPLPDAPPWEEAPIPEAPPREEPAPIRNAPVKAPVPAAAPAAPAENRDLLGTIGSLAQKKNISLFILLKEASAATQAGQEITIWFPPGKQAQLNGLSNPRNLNQLTEACQALGEGITLKLTAGTPPPGANAPAPPPPDPLTALFGDKLEIE